MPVNSQRDVVAACLCATAVLGAALFVDNPLVRASISAPCLFFFVGHCFLRAIGLVAHSAAEHITYSIGASIAICVSGGFLLNWAGYLTPLGWACWLAVAVWGTAAVTLIRPGRPMSFWPPTRLPGFQMWHAVVIAVAIAVTSAAYALDLRDEGLERQFKYTEFWMVPARPDPGSFVIGITSAEVQTRRFDVEVKLDGSTVALWRAVSLEPGATWIREFTVALDTGKSHKAEALLFEPADNAVYRRVSAFIPGT